MSDVTQTAEGETLELALANAQMLASYYSRQPEHRMVQVKYRILDQGRRDTNGSAKSFVKVEATFKSQ